MTEIISRLQRIRLIRYGFASVAALAVDMGCFLVLLALMVPAAPASAAAYCAGIITHWMLSSRTVFTDTVAVRGPERTRQKALFLGSALVGLALTIVTVGAGDLAGVDPRGAKIVAIGVSFAATWLLRSRIVFRNSP